ncbi:hypothetical protein RM533_03530 [Croceicoccus sp. F390]|uniref:Cytochrome C oxidase assembly protein n=1 Tax=Croceicoccus esteveae TaxID=3075597 RepID=A0ABU2ZIL5_9SPHN|nr:hypothetical protein [Croceicoccus sp. F390]MDT0575252.1 hypothetical protein [Croceicoccus sp. F390]
MKDDRDSRDETPQDRVKSRNLVLGAVLIGLVVMFYALTIVRFPTPEERSAAAAEQDGVMLQ